MYSTHVFVFQKIKRQGKYTSSSLLLIALSNEKEMNEFYTFYKDQGLFIDGWNGMMEKHCFFFN